MLTWHFTEPWVANKSRWTSEAVCTSPCSTTSSRHIQSLRRVRMHLCCPRAQHVSANSLCLLKQYEDQLGGRCYKDCQKLDWNTFPGLDPMTATILEWGHSMTGDQWADFPANSCSTPRRKLTFWETRISIHIRPSFWRSMQIRLLVAESRR